MLETCTEKRIEKTQADIVNNNIVDGDYGMTPNECDLCLKGNTLETIPQSVYDALPSLIKKGTDAFDIERERDFYLTALLSVLSGCLTNISGTYDGHEVYPNLFAINIAPPASGKGRMKFAEVVVRPLQQEITKKYEAELKQFKANKNKSGIASPPAFQTLFIAGNSSSAAIIKQLKNNGGKGIIFETEADTLGNAFSQDWGAFLSELVRCSFQQETLRYQRSTNDVFIEIDKPKLAIALSGTPDQVKPIISSVQNGLFSRFLYYTFSGNVEFKKIGKDVNGRNLTSYFENLSIELCAFITSFLKKDFAFEFTDFQFGRSYEYFKDRTDWNTIMLGEEFSSVMFRLSLNHYKICMVLSALRQHDHLTEKNGLIICKDEDFNIGLELIDVYLQHAIEVYYTMKKHGFKEITTLKQLFYDCLPSGNFDSKFVTSLVPKIGREERSLQYYLSEFVKKGIIQKVSHGVYKKPK